MVMIPSFICVFLAYLDVSTDAWSLDLVDK